MELIRDYSSREFIQAALEVFRYQAENVAVYGEFIHALGINPSSVDTLEAIPFLPVEFFRSQKIIDRHHEAGIVFESSGTAGTARSRHHVASPELYNKSFTKGFERFYGPVRDWCFLALLPSYLEREGSSLVYMADHLIRNSEHPQSGFYLYEHEKLMTELRKLQSAGQKTLLLGVSFALTDLAEEYREDLSGITFMETGGMKGRKKEMIREEVHALLRESFGLRTVHSEYGMTELLSQAYSEGDGLFRTPPWMRVMIRDTHDPFTILPPGNSGLINVIDLANYHSCSFLSTADLGRTHTGGTFEILGRSDNSDIRGCNLLIA